MRASREFTPGISSSLKATNQTPLIDPINTAMPPVLYSRIPEHVSKPISCPVCLGDFEANDNCRITMCDHVFHLKCIDSWMGKTDVLFLN